MCRLSEIPEEIEEAFRLSKPYVEFIGNKHYARIREDAPQNMQEAYKKFHDFYWSLEQ